MGETTRSGPRLTTLPGRSQISVHFSAPAVPALAAALGVATLPGANQWREGTVGSILWLGPDEILVLAPESSRESLLVALTKAVADGGGVVDLSASRVELELTGPDAREVLATSTSIDLHPRGFGVGDLALTLVARTQVILFQTDPAPSYRILVRPSFADYLIRWLSDAIDGVVAVTEFRRN